MKKIQKLMMVAQAMTLMKMLMTTIKASNKMKNVAWMIECPFFISILCFLLP